MSETAETETPARETIIALLTQAFSEGDNSKLDEATSRKWVEALVSLYDRQAQGATSGKIQGLCASAQRVRDLHEQRDSETGAPYCDVCANHGDITWPCATIRALDGEK